jgi:hypothetical protein
VTLEEPLDTSGVDDVGKFGFLSVEHLTDHDGADEDPSEIVLDLSVHRLCFRGFYQLAASPNWPTIFA